MRLRHYSAPMKEEPTSDGLGAGTPPSARRLRAASTASLPAWDVTPSQTAGRSGCPPPSWAVSIRIVRIWEGVTSHAERDAIEAARRRRADGAECSPRPSDVGSSFHGSRVVAKPHGEVASGG